MSQKMDLPSLKSIEAVLQIISPGSIFQSMHTLEGDFSNSTHLVEAQAADGAALRVVTRRYAIFGSYDRGEKARREFRTLQLMYKVGVPVPEPLYLDDSGAVLGTPGIVTRFVPGRLLLAPPYPADWAQKLAKCLADIHSAPYDAGGIPFLLDANREALWFVQSGETIPNYISAHPLGAAVWKAIIEQLPAMQKTPPAIVHIDYWAGNILWEAEQISAVVDWEEAAYGDPGIDVAYCRMDMILLGMQTAADEFLQVYEAEMGKPVSNLKLWQLAAAIRPMFNPEGWISESPAIERFTQFIEQTISSPD
jgi:aminoglycoside phosphotransferase (APT) family kinase protein